jgi:hypothetical protein
MKYFFTATFFLFAFSINAQLLRDVTKKRITYRVSIADSSGFKIGGYLAGFTDSSVLIATNELQLSNFENAASNKYQAVHYRNVIEIGFRKKGTTIKKMFRTGLTVTAITAGISYSAIFWFFSSSSDFLFTLKDVSPIVISVSTFTGFIGALIAGGLSSTSEKTDDNYIILGTKDNFDSMKKQILMKINPKFK